MHSHNIPTLFLGFLAFRPQPTARIPEVVEERCRRARQRSNCGGEPQKFLCSKVYRQIAIYIYRYIYIYIYTYTDIGIDIHVDMAVDMDVD